MSNQSDLQASIRVITGTTGTYEEDWHALFDADALSVGAFNERLLAWINGQLSASHTNLPGAQAAYAAAQGVARWVDVMSIKYGPELIANGHFNSTDDWTLGSGFSIAGGVLSLNNDGTFTSATNTGGAALQAGTEYLVSMTLSNHVAGGVRFGVGPDVPVPGGWQSDGFFSTTYTPSVAGVLRIDRHSNIGNNIVDIDNVSVREVL
jgi:hypothetical protein